MLLAYADESYTKQRYYVAAVVVDGDQIGSLTKAMDQIVRETAFDHGRIKLDSELHAYDLISGINAWEGLDQKVRARISVYKRVLDAIVAHGALIISRGVDIPRLDARHPGGHDHPHSVVLTFLIEELDRLAANKQDHALLIADEVSGQDGYRRDLWNYQQSSTWGYMSRRITRVVDTIHFAPSHASRLVQAADMVAFLIRRRETVTETDDRAERAYTMLRETIAPAVWSAKCWFPDPR